MSLIKGIDVAYIHTSSLDSLKAWYREKLGLEINYGDGHWEEFSVDRGSRFALDGVTEDTPSEVERQPIILSFRVDDIETAVATLASRGVRFFPSVEKTVFSVGPALVATFQDGDGNWMQLSQPRATA